MITTSAMEDSTQTRKVIFGTCGWSDQSMISCGRFYPPKTNSASDRLAFYSRTGGFGCVEVDCSSYAIPSPDSVKKWVDATPPKFAFHFKAFGAFTLGSIEVRCLPPKAKSRCGVADGRVSFDSLSEECKVSIWTSFHEALAPALEAKKLGSVVFQFQLSVVPSEAARRHVEYCAMNLMPQCRMSVEFRNRKWVDQDNFEATVSWLRRLRPEGVCLIACDDLEHEVLQGDKSTKGLPPGQLPVRMPIVLTSRACPAYAYIRLHRRQGTERVLSQKEMLEWRERLQNLLNERASISSTVATSKEAESGELPGPTPIDDNINRPAVVAKSCSDTASESIVDLTLVSKTPENQPEYSLQGPIYFLIGTDHEDQPVLNMKGLYEALSPELRFDWRASVSKGRDIKSLFAKQGRSEEPAPSTAIDCALSPSIGTKRQISQVDSDLSMHTNVLPHTRAVNEKNSRTSGCESSKAAVKDTGSNVMDTNNKMTKSTSSGTSKSIKSFFKKL